MIFLINNIFLLKSIWAIWTKFVLDAILTTLILLVQFH